MTGSAAWRPRDLDRWLERLSARDLGVLEDLERFRLLSTALVTRLHFTEGHASPAASTRGAVRVLGRLEAHGLVARLARRVGGSARGSSGTVWQLAASGERFLRARRGDAARRRFHEPSLGFAAHTLAISQLAVDLITGARSGAFDLLVLETEPHSWRSFTTAAGSVAWVKPDLGVITADDETETHSWVEVDRGTEHVPAVVRKNLLYQRYYDSGGEQALRGVYPAVVWSVPDAARAQRIERAIHDERALDDRLFVVRPVGQVLSALAPPPA